VCCGLQLIPALEEQARGYSRLHWLAEPSIEGTGFLLSGRLVTGDKNVFLNSIGVKVGSAHLLEREILRLNPKRRAYSHVDALLNSLQDRSDEALERRRDVAQISLMCIMK
jgi:hypothetical protein